MIKNLAFLWLLRSSVALGLHANISAKELYMPTSPSPPAYSPLLLAGEARLEHNPSRRSTNTFNDTWLRNEGQITIALADQDRGAPYPVYGRRGNIHGAILLDSRAHVESVVIKVSKYEFNLGSDIDGRWIELALVGQIVSSTAEGGSTTLTMIDLTCHLWSPHPTEPASLCPGAIPFSIVLPENYTDERTLTSHPLAPTYAVSLPNIGLLVEYHILVEVGDKRGPVLGFISRNSLLRIPIIYQPRTRPSQPLLYQPVFLSSVKSSPEEWKQSLIEVKTKDGANVGPLSCSLFLPALQVFAITDFIPIHIQMTGTLTSLLLFFPSQGPKPPSPSESVSRLKVQLIRQVTIKMDHKSYARNTVIGGCALHPMPPPASPSPPRSPGNARLEQEHMDWAGDVRCYPDVSVGSFNASGCSVKDYIILDLYPPLDSPFIACKNGVGVSIVTNPWRDDILE